MTFTRTYSNSGEETLTILIQRRLLFLENEFSNKMEFTVRLRLKMHFGRMETSLLNTSPVFWMKLVINLVWRSNTEYISKINFNQIFSSWSHFRCEKRRLNHATPIQLATRAIWTTRKWWRQRLTIIIPDIKRNKRLLHMIAPHKRFANRIYSPW